MIDSTFNRKTGLLETKLHGPVSADEVLAYVKSLREGAEDYPQKLKIITDASEAEMGFSTDDLNMILKVVNDHPELYESINDAMVMSSPRATAFSMIVEMFTKNSRYHVKIFSTRKAALKWLSSQ